MPLTACVMLDSHGVIFEGLASVTARSVSTGTLFPATNHDPRIEQP